MAPDVPDDMHQWKVTTDTTADATNVGNFLKVRQSCLHPAPLRSRPRPSFEAHESSPARGERCGCYVGWYGCGDRRLTITQP
jgi:hypothetical protein